MRRLLLPALASLAILFAGGPVRATEAQQAASAKITKMERNAMRTRVRVAANEHIVKGNKGYDRPGVSIPFKSMKRTEGGGLQVTATISSWGVGWSPVPQRLPQETATFLKLPGQPLINVTGWTKIDNGQR